MNNRMRQKIRVRYFVDMILLSKMSDEEQTEHLKAHMKHFIGEYRGTYLETMAKVDSLLREKAREG